MSWLPPKRWKVTTTFVSPITFGGWLLGYGESLKDWLPEPEVTVKLYRWRFPARLAALTSNSFNAINPPMLFGMVTAEVTPLYHVLEAR